MTLFVTWTSTPPPLPVRLNTTDKHITSAPLDARKASMQIPRNISTRPTSISTIIRMNGDAMMKKFMFALFLVTLLSQFAVSAAFAAEEPAGSCPTGFHLEMSMDHDQHHHQHVGTDADLNSDGWICVKHLTPDEKIHLHVDNYLP
jgi:hypothetical protein